MRRPPVEEEQTEKEENMFSSVQQRGQQQVQQKVAPTQPKPQNQMPTQKTQKPQKKKESDTVTLHLPAKVWKQFEAVCILLDVDPQEQLIQLMQKFKDEKIQIRR